MTDERRPDEPEIPDSATPQNEPATEPPPPLAPLVNHGGQAAHDASADASDTTAQPMSASTQPAATSTPPPIPPPAMPTPAIPPSQPAVTWAPAPAPVAAAAGQRTTISLVAGILLIIGGILGGLAGLAVAVFGNAIVQSLEDLGGLPTLEGMDMAAFMSGFIVFFGIIILVYSLVYLFAGIGVLRSRDWGRVLGLIVGILSGLLWLGSVATPDQPGVRDSIVGSLIAFGIHAYIVVALLFFWRTKPSTA
jgi:hypothetical protein